MDAKKISRSVCVVLIGILSITIGSTYGYAEDGAASEEEVNTGQDFAKPLTRFDIRLKTQQSGDVDTLFWTFRVDKPFPLDNGWKLSTRFDLPLVYSEAPSRDNPNGDWEAGVGDFLAQAVLIAPRQGSWVAAVGVQTLWPIATQDQFGTGKYQLAPLVAAVHYPDWLPPGSFFAGVVQDYFDVGGKGNRADIHELSIKPVVNVNFPDPSGPWFVTFAPDMRVNWEDDNKWHVPFNMTLGKMLGKKTVISVEWNQTIVDSYDKYDWQLVFRIGFFF